MREKNKIQFSASDWISIGLSSAALLLQAQERLEKRRAARRSTWIAAKRPTDG